MSKAVQVNKRTMLTFIGVLPTENLFNIRQFVIGDFLDFDRFLYTASWVACSVVVNNS